LLHIVAVLFCFGTYAQRGKGNSIQKNWDGIRKTISYQPSEKYKGPKGGKYGSPAAMDQSQYGSGSGNGYNSSGSSPIKSYSGTPISQRQLQSGKNVPQNPGGKNGSGTIERDPNIVPSEPIDFPESDGPDMDAPDLDVNAGTGDFWKTLGIIILILLAVYVIYLIIKNHQPKEKSIPFEPLQEDMNPETISKTELELRLEEAMREENYRECVRIYFLFAMKELMSRRMVYWKKEKTNMHYIIEMQGKNGLDSFERIVGYYDIVWYGDYNIDNNAYSSMQPQLEKAYKKLEAL